ncbi:MAG: TonB-dependent receptor [Pseudomonadota bacterium]
MTIQDKHLVDRSRPWLSASIGAAALIATGLPVNAQAPVELDGILVTGGLTPVQTKSFGRATTVITSEELTQRGIKTLPEALRLVPGFAVAKSGGVGGLTEVRIRGSEANHVLVLIDGIEAANMERGFNFANVTADEIERIEVVRGPQSVFFGSAALAGVINIITKRGIRNGARAGATAEAGTAPAKSFSALVQAGNARMDFAVSGSHRDDEGWDASGDGGEKDGGVNTTVSTKVTADITSALRLQGILRLTDRKNEFDATAFACGNADCYVRDAGNTFEEGRDQYAALMATYKMLDGALVHSPFFHYSDTENFNNTPQGFSSSSSDKADKRRYGYKVAFSFGGSRQHTLAGLVEKKKESFTSNNFSDEAKREQTSFAAEYRGFLTPELFVQGGVRKDNNSTFEDFTTWTASASYLFEATNTRFHGSVGKGIVNPSFTEQFGFFGNFIGNPDLLPEESLGWDAGVEQTLFGGALVVDATFFKADLTNEIGSRTLPGFISQPINRTGESERKGVEVQITLKPIQGLTVTGVYTYVDSTDADGLIEARRPKHSGGIKTAYTFLRGKAHIGVDVTYKGEDRQPDFGAASPVTFISPIVTVDDSVVVDLNGSYQLTESVKVYGVVNNLFDQESTEALGFASRPTTAYLGVKVGY